MAEEGVCDQLPHWGLHAPELQRYRCMPSCTYFIFDATPSLSHLGALGAVNGGSCRASASALVGVGFCHTLKLYTAPYA